MELADAAQGGREPGGGGVVESGAGDGDWDPAAKRGKARVDYALSDLGRSLLPLVVAVGRWAETHEPTIATARLHHDFANAE